MPKYKLHKAISDNDTTLLPRLLSQKKLYLGTKRHLEDMT